MDTSQYETKDLEHLGIVAGMCKRIGLIERIDEMVPDTGREVSVGQATQAMVLNGLGFVSRPLYLTPEFYRTKPVDLLIGEGITAEQLNDDCLGRALDHLYEVGVTEIFAHVAHHALQEVGIETRYVHLDTTSFALHGEYEFGPAEQAEMIEITHGYSRDHRPDLKQAVLSLITAHQGALPVWMEALDGNSADSASFKQTVRTYTEQLTAEEETPCVVADSAFYNAGTLEEVGAEVLWLTRVPASIGLARELYQQVLPEEMEPIDDTYRVLPLGSVYGDVKQRWLLVYSDDLYQQQEKRFQRRLEKERKEAEKGLRQLGRREYPSPEAAQAAVETLSEQWKFHTAAVTVKPVTRYNKRGRPAVDQPPDYYTYQPVGDVLDDETAIAARLARKGKFILATNDLDEERLSNEAMITVYKGQNITVERGFRFLKDPLFFADSFFLKKPSRIMALLMVMGLCLLVYSLTEHILRTQLVEQNETVPDQKGKPTQRITMRRVFQVFEGIHVLIIHEASGAIRRLITNLSELHRKILRLLGPPFEKCYSVPL